MRTQVGIVGAGPAGTDAVAPAAPARRRLGGDRSADPGDDRADDQGRDPGAEHGRPDAPDRGGRPDARATGSSTTASTWPSRGGMHRINLLRAHRRPGGDGLRPARGAQGPHRRGGSADGADVRFGVTDTAGRRPDDRAPTITFTHEGEQHTLECDFIIGADGSRTYTRFQIPQPQVRTDFFRQYPFAWFGILAEAPPSSDELIYAHSERGFVLISTRSPKVQRLYFQCDPDTQTEDWSDDRIWSEFEARLGPDRRDGDHRATSSRRTCCSSAASSASRCSTAGCSWPGTPRTPCRRPARRA